LLIQPLSLITCALLVNSQAIDAFSHFVPRPKKDKYSFRYVDSSAGPWIPPNPGFVYLHSKSAKSSQLDSITPRQGSDNFVEDGIHDFVHVPLKEMRVVTSKTEDQF
jgi:hypothetical protein